MGTILIVVLAALGLFGLAFWLALVMSVPMKPATIYRSKAQRCFDCHQPLTDRWFHVMKCDRCLVAYLNRMDAGEIGKVDGAMSVAELEALWTK